MTDEHKAPEETGTPPEEKEKRKRAADDREVEYSFDFSKLSDTFNRVLGSLAGDEEVKTTEISIARENATSASIEIDFSAGEHVLTALPAGSENLLEAKIVHVGEIDIREEGTERILVKISQRNPQVSRIVDTIQQGFRAAANRTDLRWEIAISPDLPIDLEVDGGAGPVRLDLSNIQLEQLEVDSGVGTMEVRLPVSENSYRVDVDSGVGQTKIFVPDGANIDLDIDAGVGLTELIVPATVAARIKGDSGVGSIKLPDHFTRLKGKNDFFESGVWETEGFELAERRLIVKYDGGVGQFTVRTPDIV